MKKTGMIFVFAIFSILFLNFASAYFPGSLYLGRGGDLIDNIVIAGAPVLEALFGGYTESAGEFSSGEILFIKFLLFLIMFVVIQSVLKRVPAFKDNLAVIGILAVAIPLIAIRFMSANNMIYSVLLPYGTLGIALTTILPFMIFFWFIHQTGLHGTGRRVSWIFFTIVFLVLWANRTDEIGDIGNQIYAWTSLAMILVLIFDKQLHTYLELSQLKGFFSKADNIAIASLKAEYNNLKSSVGAASDKDIQKRLREIEKELKHYKIHTEVRIS